MIDVILRLYDYLRPKPFYTWRRTDTPHATIYVFIVGDLFPLLAKFKGRVCGIEPLGSSYKVTIAYPRGTRLRLRCGWWSRIW